jgi:RNA polymerase sigma-70 factor (ECF subfamily)
MHTRTPLNAATRFVAGALLERLAVSVRLAAPIQADDKLAASAELDRTVRPVFVLANQHMRWELNDLARRLDERQAAAVGLHEGLVPAPASTAFGLNPDGLRMVQAIDELPEDEREVFDLVRIDGMTQAGAAHVLGVSAVTVNRRLCRGLRLLPEKLADLRRGEKPRDVISVHTGREWVLWVSGPGT